MTYAKLRKALVFISIKTSGPHTQKCELQEVAAYRLANGEITSQLWLLSHSKPEQLTEIAAFLDEHIVVSLHGRWVSSFLKNSFKPLALNCRFSVLCLTKLFRKLEQVPPKLLSNATCEQRALALLQCWQKLQNTLPNQLVEDSLVMIRQSSIPPALQDLDWSNMYDSFGVYLIYGINQLPIYIGKSNNVKKRLRAHFSSDHRLAKEMTLSLQAKRIEIIKCQGELDALLTEARLIKALKPTLNRRLRSSKCLFSWALEASPDYYKLHLVSHTPTNNSATFLGFYGLFNTKREATQALKKTLLNTGLCQQTLGLTSGQLGNPCFDRQLKHCQGACIGAHAANEFNQQLLKSLAKLPNLDWPFTGGAVIAEQAILHVVKEWRYMGSASTLIEARTLAQLPLPSLDKDTFKILLDAKDLLTPLTPA